MISGQSQAKSLEWAPRRKYVGISAFNHKKEKGRQKDEMAIRHKEGSLWGPDDYE